jgi:hypothetical protein
MDRRCPPNLELPPYETWVFAAPALSCRGPPPAPYHRLLSRAPPVPPAELQFDSWKKPSPVPSLYIVAQSKVLLTAGPFLGFLIQYHLMD